MKKTIVFAIAILMVCSLAGCAGTKQGTVISVSASISLDALLGNEPIKNEDVTFGNTVVVQTEDGQQYNALWDEALLGKPVGFDLEGVVVAIQKTSDPDVWKVTKIISEP